ncbi:hypothetical protein [Amycolatopsis sp. NPDC059021]|uniref:hypothetical protein n=1 Tax=Amycolatopsis sp. NPDC059021 TaxID=3346704 RepID=UPI00366EA056
MDPHRLQDKDDARRLLKQLGKQPRTPHRVASAEDVHDPSGAGNAALIADDAGRIELDPAQIAAADAALARHHDELSELLSQAKELEAPLRDGGSPVAKHLRRAFGLRGGADTGVQATLRDYLDELGTLRDAIRQAGASHARADEQAGESLTRIHPGSDAGAGV